MSELELVDAVKLHLRNYDDTGVPVLTVADLKSMANLTLARLDPKALLTPTHVNVAGMLNYLSSVHGTVVLFRELGARGEARILGRVVFSSNRIELDLELTQAHPAFRFTVAHEIGHWLLHRWRPIRLDAKGGVLEETVDTEDKMCRRIGSRPPNEHEHRIEYQANKYAARLIMPRRPFLLALVSKQIELGIMRRHGFVYLSNAPQSWADFNAIATHLQEIFGVSRSSVIVRIDEMAALKTDDVCRDKLFGSWRLRRPWGEM